MVNLLLLAAIGHMQTQTEVTFQGAGITLSGELLLPIGSGPFPCVLLLPGSGPTDRDGNQPPMLVTDVLKQIAVRLQADGIATFRFDKRPVHTNRDQWPKDMASWSDYFSFENHIADVTAAYETMAKQSGIDPKRLAILGHSEGGAFTTWVARDLKPKAIVLVGTPGERMEATIRFQIAQGIAKAPISEEEKQKITKSNEEAMASLIASGTLPSDIHPGLRGLYNPTAVKLMRSYLTIDPTVRLKEYEGPVLLMNGEKDIQIRATHDTPLLERALSSRTKDVHTTEIVSGASHCLKKVALEGDPGFVGPVVTEALDKISAWLNLHLVK